jgi:hypothetical protein
LKLLANPFWIILFWFGLYGMKFEVLWGCAFWIIDA